MPKPIMNYCPRCATDLVEEERSGKLRAVCPDKSCGYVFWNNPLPVVAAIVERNGHVVLVRSHGWPPHFYGLVTGFLEHKETPEEAVIREVKEEIGLEVEMGGYIGSYTFYKKNELILAYHVIAPEGEIKLDEEELDGYKEVPIEKVKPWPAGTGYALRDWLNTKGIEPEFIQF